MDFTKLLIAISFGLCCSALNIELAIDVMDSLNINQVQVFFCNEAPRVDWKSSFKYFSFHYIENYNSSESMLQSDYHVIGIVVD